MEFQPHQFGLITGGDPGVTGKSMDALTDTYYNREPEYMGRLEADIKQNGFRTPVGVKFNEKHGNFNLEAGHHRAAVANKLQIPLPADDVGDQPHIRPDRVDEAWSVDRIPAESRARNTIGERGDTFYKTRLK